MLPAGRTVGVLVSDRSSLKDIHFTNVGAPVGLPLGELPEHGVIRTLVRENRLQVDREAQQRG